MNQNIRYQIFKRTQKSKILNVWIKKEFDFINEKELTNDINIIYFRTYNHYIIYDFFNVSFFYTKILGQ